MFAQVAGGDGGWERGEILDEEEAISGEGGKYKINRGIVSSSSSSTYCR